MTLLITLSGLVICAKGQDEGINNGQLIVTQTKNGVELVCVQPQDRIWLISARKVTPCAGELSELDILSLEGTTWECRSLEDLKAEHVSDPHRESLVFVHGNRYNLEWCKSRGLQFYSRVFANCPDRPPVRLILFSWKSETEKKIRPIQDYRIKSRRSLELSCIFAKVMDYLDERKLLICGYSLGAQIVIKGISEQSPASRPVHNNLITLIAPAFDPYYWSTQLESFNRSGLAGPTKVFVNQNDKVICASELFAKKVGRDCLSTSEKIATGLMDQKLIHVFDVTAEAPGKHDLNSYLESDTIRCELRESLSKLSADHPLDVLPIQDVTAEGQVEDDVKKVAADILHTENKAGLADKQVAKPGNTNLK
ncbi:MAG: alpha/beta hydrolase [Planctomycetota bacterium]